MPNFAISTAIALSFSFSAFATTAKQFGLLRNEGRLACYKGLKDYHISTATRSSYGEAIQMPVGKKDYAHKLFKRSENQYLVIPAKRASESGFYLVSDKSSAWVPLKPEAATCVLSGEGDKKKCSTDCLHFNDEANLGGEIFVTYGNFKDWTNPGAVSKEKPSGAECVDTKFSDTLDDELKKVFAEDLITRIQDVARVTLKMPEVKNKAIRALEDCAEFLTSDADRDVLAAIENAKTQISPPVTGPKSFKKPKDLGAQRD